MKRAVYGVRRYDVLLPKITPEPRARRMSKARRVSAVKGRHIVGME